MDDQLELIGERVRLRTTVETDREWLVAIRATPEVRRRWRGDDLDAEFIEDLGDDEVEQFTIEALDRLNADGHDSGDRLNADGGDGGPGAVIGLIQYSEEEEPDYRHASLDIYLDPAVHRRGYATDAIKTLVRHLFDDVGHHRLTIDPAADNDAAIGCYAAVGFKTVGIMRQYERQADGTWADGLLMELLSTD